MLYESYNKTRGVNDAKPYRNTLNTYSYDLVKKFVIGGVAMAFLPGTMALDFKSSQEVDVVPLMGVEAGRVCFFSSQNREECSAVAALKSLFVNYYSNGR